MRQLIAATAKLDAIEEVDPEAAEAFHRELGSVPAPALNLVTVDRGVGLRLYENG